MLFIIILCTLILFFFFSIQGHFDTIYYECLCPEKQGYKKGFIVMLYQLICHKIYYFFVSVFSSSCSRAAKDRMLKIFTRDRFATGRKASSRWLNWWSMPLGWWLSPECQIIRETTSQRFWCFRWGKAHRGQLKPTWMSFSLKFWDSVIEFLAILAMPYGVRIKMTILFLVH